MPEDLQLIRLYSWVSFERKLMPEVSVLWVILALLLGLFIVLCVPE